MVIVFLDFPARTAYIAKMRSIVQSEKLVSPASPPAMRPIYLAPLRGVTDAIYRNTFAEHFGGIDRAVAPFITTHAGRRIKPAHVRDLNPGDNPNMPVIPQVLTKSADDFIVLAKYLFDMGYNLINLNCGCPFPQVANKGRGSGLLCDPDGLERLLDTVLAHIPNRLSVKTRIGRYTANEIQTIMPIFNRYPLESVTVHPRTGIQMYAGSPELAVFDWCLTECRHPVIYNGDITRLAGFKSLEGQFPGVAGWMVGRGVLANPFLADQLKGGPAVTDVQKNARFQRFHDALFERYRARLSGPGHLLDRMKGLWKYFAKGFSGSEAACKRIHKARSLPQYRSAVKAFMESGFPWVT